MRDETFNFYEIEAEKYEEKRFSSLIGRLIDIIQKKIVKELCIFRFGDILLDVGSGTGRFVIELSKNYGNIIGVDPSINMIEISRRKSMDECEQSNIEYVLANAEFLPIRRNSIQQSISINVLNHIIQYKAVLDEISRVIQRQGLFVANFPVLQSIYFLIGILVNSLKRDVFHGVYSKWFSLGEIFEAYSNRNFTIHEYRGYFSPAFPLSNKLSSIISRFVLNSNKIVNDSFLKYLAGVLFIKAMKI